MILILEKSRTFAPTYYEIVGLLIIEVENLKKLTKNVSKN